MTISVANYNDVTVLTVKEELTSDTVEVFNNRASGCHEEGHYHIVVDCSSLGGLDSAGLEALLALQNQCEDQLGTLKLCCLDETCTKILEITRLARRFEVHEDLESAVKSFS